MLDTELIDDVFAMVKAIPRGKVSSYGAIAKTLGIGPRQVGQILHKNIDPETIPCHRVVHSDGSLAGGYAFGGEDKQREKLESEGVRFVNGKVTEISFT